MSTIGRIRLNFNQTVSLGKVEIPVNARPVRSSENIDGIRDIVAEENIS